ncbi:hypothetical protein [Scytonema sp. NUACC26]
MTSIETSAQLIGIPIPRVAGVLAVEQEQQLTPRAMKTDTDRYT